MATTTGLFRLDSTRLVTPFSHFFVFLTTTSSHTSTWFAAGQVDLWCGDGVVNDCMDKSECLARPAAGSY
ncbi:expressed unknown protein [Seminavis robusta]|uniref:Uncharacterized protein n=1 Tax=Seminavis robusta TaxID=568900 RepID=A0A9N8E6K9_9STRA|nr:expressed unknown protein [Seminavis robusta]|eukprot:Sro552_g164990.1 n/a (70) ;mRNA; r:6266-6671